MAFETIRLSINTATLWRLTSSFETVKAWVTAGHTLAVEIRAETRSSAQNRILWSIMSDLSRQCEWAVDGQMVKLSSEDVKHILTAGLKRHQRMARGVDGGLVILGQSTSKMTKAELAELIELAYAFGAQQGVRWSRTSLSREVPDCVCLEEAT